MQIVLNGLISGLSIALLAVAFQLVYLPTRIFYIALAGLYTLAPYCYWAFQRSNAPWYLSAAGAVAIIGTLAMVIEWVNHAPLSRKNASEGVQLVSSLGIFIILSQIVVIIWGNQPKTLRLGLDWTVNLGESILTGAQLTTAATATVLLVGFLVVLRLTDIGLRLRALADNPIQFALFGYNVDAYRIAAFALSGLFVTVASILTAWDVGFDPHTGLHAVLLAVVAVIVGGRGTFAGPIAGGILLGVLRAQVVWHLSARWQAAVTFVILALFLLLRPNGLFGRKGRLEAMDS